MKNLKQITSKVNHISRIFHPTKAILEVKPQHNLDFDFQYFQIRNHRLLPSKLPQPLVLPSLKAPVIKQLDDNKFEVNTNGSVPAFYLKAIADFHPRLVSCLIQPKKQLNQREQISQKDVKKLWKSLSSFKEPKISLKCLETPNYDKSNNNDRRWMFLDQAPMNFNSKQFLKESQKYTTLTLAPLARYEGGLELIPKIGYGLFHFSNGDTNNSIVQGSGYNRNPKLTEYHIKMNRIYNKYYQDSEVIESGKFLPRFPTIYNSTECHYIDLVHLYLMILKEGGKAELVLQS